jgi:VRR-NUC domain-containing protein
LINRVRGRLRVDKREILKNMSTKQFKKGGIRDANQKEIVKALLAIGATVQDLGAVGQGVPDLLVGHHGLNCLMEVKTKTGKVNAKQVAWHENWRGSAVIVRTVSEALAVLGIKPQ